jgi:SAM-dependent methyltransferase
MMSTHNSMSMSSATGKQILSLIRNGDYAHAGEEEAIRLTLDGLAPSHDRQVLDIGCGLGGTVDYISRLGLGRVTGIDIDYDTISYATKRYPGHTFACGPAGEASRYLQPGFSLVVIFNALYTFPDQVASLREAHTLAAPESELRIFEYTAASETPAVKAFCERYGRGRWRPVMVDQSAEMLSSAGWKLDTVTDLTPQYELWYSELVHKIQSKQEEIVSRHGDRWFDYALRRYQELLDVIQEGVIGGAIFKAIRL